MFASFAKLIDNFTLIKIYSPSYVRKGKNYASRVVNMVNHTSRKTPQHMVNSRRFVNIAHEFASFFTIK